MTKFQIIDRFRGYQRKTDLTNLPPGVLVSGSQNVLFNDGERIASRQGYTLDGDASTALTPILSAYDWMMHTGDERHLRSYYNELQYRYVDSADVVTWRTLQSGWADLVNFNYTEFWDTSELIDVLLMVNGSANIYEWSGGITTYASSSATAISIKGNNALLTSGTPSTASSAMTLYNNGLFGTGLEIAIVFNSQPANGDVLTLNYNGGGATVQFVSVIGATAGNVLIGATLADTITNLLGLLTAPGTTNATQVALSAPNQTVVGYTTNVATKTITKQGTTTWGEESFFVSGTRAVTINGISYTYTGGEGTTTLTGITPDPSGAGIAVGAVIHQTLRTYANESATDIALAKNDLISTLNNQVYVGDLNNRSVYVSQVDSFTDFSFGSPRAVGEGAILTLDGCPVGLISQENDMYVTAGLNQWYQTNFTLSSDNTDEALTVTRLKTTPQTASQSQAFLGKIKNYIFFVDNEPSLTTLGKLELIDTPQSVNISDPIKIDFDNYNFTGGCTFYFKNFIYVAIPAEGVVRLFNLAKGFWEAPQILPISRFSIISGELYGHSSQVPETYKMFDGYNDNGNPISAVAAFSYQNFGDRANNKNMNQMYSEGYMTTNTTLDVSVLYDYLASSGSASFSIFGSDPIAVRSIGGDGSLGKQSLGVASLAGREDTTDDSIPPKFRVINTFPKTDFYECQFIYSSNGVDQRWELLAIGPNAMDATSTNSSITAILN